MPKDKIISFFEKYPEICYEKGDKILRPNEYFDHIYFAKKGYIRIYKVLKTGQEISINWFNPAKQNVLIFGYTSLLSQYYVEAFTEVVLNRAPKVDFQTYADAHSEVKKHSHSDMQIFFEEALRQVEWLSIPDAYTRIKVAIYTLAQRIGTKDKDKLLLVKDSNPEIRMTHHIIASFTGLTRETVTVQINKLIAEKFISRHGNMLVIENLEGLVADIR
jgi:CRP-like cAMP-binding protein